jgi:OOP family OmpA-OmpF porin
MNKRDSASKKILWIFLLSLFLITWLPVSVKYSHVLAQDPKTLLFQEADEALQKAKEIQANIFSPTQFRSGMKYYTQAEEDYGKNKNLEDIREKLKIATANFLKAIETTKLAQTHLKECISARNDALSAEAHIFRKKAWEEAESALEDASKDLEDGNLKSAKNKSGKAERLYRTVELEAIKANYLDETKTLLEKHEKELKKRTPITLKNAEELVTKAEKILVEDRYNTDQARQSAQEAKYEAKHGIYLSKHIEQLKEEDKTIEEILLVSEKPIQRIADEFDLNARFDQGADNPTQAIVHEIEKMKKHVVTLEQDIKDKDEQLATLTNQLTALESQLGDLKSEKAGLSTLMEQQKLLREKFNRLENMFTPSQARVERMGDNVVIRLYGLNFASGQSTIKPEYFELLAKVVEAFKEYPECGITVEGHTDSWGSDMTNQKLSTERADAVKKYLLATAGIAPSRIIAVGFGETKPIASNETKEGRRKNRRIDIVIHPKK